MVDSYSIRLYKNNKRVSAKHISPLDVRLFYRDLKKELKFFEVYYEKFLNNKVIVRVGDVEFFVDRKVDSRKLVRELIQQYKSDCKEVEINGFLYDVSRLPKFKIITVSLL